jgi:hypothetical protein
VGRRETGELKEIEETRMRNRIAVGLACVVAVLVTLCTQTVNAQANDTDFQAGKIVAVEKVSSTGGQATTGGTDAPSTPQVDRYNLSIQVGDTIYVCRARIQPESSFSWTQGKEVNVKVNGKTMYVRRSTGKVEKLSILSSKKAS